MDDGAPLIDGASGWIGVRMIRADSVAPIPSVESNQNERAT
jgi:hypothetical protein